MKTAASVKRCWHTISWRPSFTLPIAVSTERVPVFGRTGTVHNATNRVDAYRMIRRRTAQAGFTQGLGCHVFRATGITAYLEAGGTLKNAQAMTAHESPRTTRLYDRSGDQITLDEVERITI
jgi:integrase